MRPFLTLVIVLILTALAAPVSHAQRDTIAPPVGGVYQTHYETEYPDRLAFFLHWKNICLERFVTLNPDLDPEYIPYGTLITLPRNEPCYDYTIVDHYIGTWSRGMPPRLKYFEEGTWLSEPYYSADVTYIYADSVEVLAEFMNICLDELLDDNYNVAHYPLHLAGALSADVFIPTDAQPCDPEYPITYSHQYSSQPNYEIITIPKRDLMPLVLSQEYGICAESIMFNYGLNIYEPIPQHTQDPLEIYIYKTDLSCYNEIGQRLRYFGDDGKRLARPEYTNLQVYITQPDDTVQTIAADFGVCVTDFLRINNFPQLPTQTSIELFIPEARQCQEAVFLSLLDPSDIGGRGNNRNLTDIALAYNICVEGLSPINPHLGPRLDDYQRQHITYGTADLPIPVLLPALDIEPCYGEFVVEPEANAYEIELALNICQEDLIFASGGDIVFYRLDSKPCYDEKGQRLRYPNIPSGHAPHTSPYLNRLRNYIKDAGAELSYSPLTPHTLQQGEYLIDISRHYNVCIEDILQANPNRPPNYPIFIPETPTCYDEESGLQLVYRDAEGNPLDPPQTRQHIMYYGILSPANLVYYYNVCINRIEDANRAKLNGDAIYLGWIIPTDRPPCYGERGQRLYYVCYEQPINFNVDYSAYRSRFNPSYDGTHCYDITNPQTPVWYDGKLYFPRRTSLGNQRYMESWLMNSPAFLSWCYGVPQAEFTAIKANPALTELLPNGYGLIPAPKRSCYMDNPAILDGHTLHVVGRNETLAQIADQYNVPSFMIAWANDLGDSDTIWLAQTLIIPKQSTSAQVYALVLGTFVSLLLVAGLIIPLARQTKNRD